MHGARGVILVNDAYPHHTAAEDRLDAFGQATGPTDAGVLFVQVKESTAEAWLKTEGRDLHEILDGIDKDLKPHSFPLTKLTVNMSLDIQHDMKTVHNVAAYLPGKTTEYVIIGAHYDHLGLGDEHSLAPSQIGTDPSRRRRQRLGHRGRDRTGPLVLASSRSSSAGFCL